MAAPLPAKTIGNAMETTMPNPGETVRFASRGFTLIELMIAVAILAILLSVGVPSYREFLRRGDVEEIAAALGTGRVVIEQFFLDNRTYEDAPCPDNARHFTVACDLTATTYAVTATGTAFMAGFVYTIDEANLRTTAGPWGSGNCWITRKGDAC